MTGIYHADAQALKSFHAGRQLRRVIDNRVGIWSSHVLQQVAAEQVAVSCQDSDGAPGMPRKVEHPSVEPVFSQIIPVIDREVGTESLELARPDEQGEDLDGDPAEDPSGKVIFLLLRVSSPFSVTANSSRCMAISAWYFPRR